MTGRHLPDSGATVVIVGGGQAGAQLASSLRGNGFTGRIAMVSDDTALPYQRPPLSKGYLTGRTGPEAVRLHGPEYYAENSVQVLTGDPAVRVLPSAHRVLLRSGTELRYEHLVLATGARNRSLPVPGADLPGVVGLRTLAEADVLRERLASADRLVVVGGGFVGMEVSSSATDLGARVSVIEAHERVMARALTPVTSEFFAEAHRVRGVRLELGEQVARFLGTATVTGVETASGRRLPADLVLVGIGVEPNTDLAEDAGLDVRDGIVVDALLRTSAPDISAIGDCARFPTPFAAAPVRLESVQNAVDQARCVAARLTGTARPYRPVPWFWSRQAGVRLQIAGLTGGHDRTVVRGDLTRGEFSVLCFRGDRLLGAESVGQPAAHMAVRRALETGDRAMVRELVDGSSAP
ncbi:NAD(P)/FAD-dependent oxidoreductase [Streptomyces rimosus]|uniref:NAD(P)/FAD-dependent oxidoreductase n=1 Tax=Streptomyces rimosus TaxID=1927 RepID=UPI00067AD515|nr:FAD-dependent oxidoreductase [Streptomyces rimosus]